MNSPYEFAANPFANNQPPQIDLARSPFERPFFVDMEAFFDFSFWISEELLDLEATQKAKEKTKANRLSSRFPKPTLCRSQRDGKPA